MSALEVLLLAFFLIFIVLILIRMDRNYRLSEETDLLKRIFSRRSTKP